MDSTCSKRAFLLKNLRRGICGSDFLGHKVTPIAGVQLVCGPEAKIGANHRSYWSEPETLRSLANHQSIFAEPSLIDSPPGRKSFETVACRYPSWTLFFALVH
jgi:hypothetical protein